MGIVRDEREEAEIMKYVGVHDVNMGKGRVRKSFATIDEVVEMPDLIEVQKNSYDRFLKEDLREVLNDVSPIYDFNGNLKLEFVDYSLDKTPKYSLEECRERDMTYATALKVLVRLTNNETGEVKESEVFMGDFPLMTEHGTFIINGGERVIVSQLVRSPGVYYRESIDKAGKHLFDTQVIPSRGAWLEYEIDSNDVIWVRVDRARKLPVTSLLRALGYGSDEQIRQLLGDDEKLEATMQRDGGDAMSTINPDDIASISLLKGASAAALYGAVAANGAIMITTKSAMAGRLAVNVSSNTTIDTPLSLPEFQNTYGANGQYSWGDKLASKAPDYAEKFFRTGWTTNNSISINGGAEDLRAYFSYGNVTSGGITPENDYSQHTLNAKVGFDLFNDHIKVDFNAKYVNQHISNQPAGGFVFNPLVGTYTFPRGGDWNGYKSNFETYNGELNANVQNWVTTTDETNSNPYWLLNRERPVVERNRYEFGGSIKYQIIDGLSLTGRMRYERADEHYVRNHYASSYGNKYTYGKMDDNRYFSEQLYADLLAQYNHTWDDFSLNATLGTSMMQTRSNNVSLLYEQSKFVAPGNGGAYYPNIFNPSNFYKNGTTMGLERKRLNSVFGAVTFGFKEALFLDVTARNDWSSALAYTDGYSFFYPSVGASLLLNRFVDMGRNIDLFKFRGSYSIVGNDVPVYKTNPRYTYGDQGAINPPESVPFRTLKPEKTHSFEVGFDGEFFQHRLHVNATYYKTNTKNQYFEVTLPWESGYKSQFVNAGNVQNQGFELTAGWFQDFGNEFTWSTDLNLSYNDNKIIELFDGIQDGVTVSNLGGAKVILYEGGQYGDLYVRTLKRDESGKLVTETPEGADYQIPVNGGEQNSDLKYMGNMNSKWNMGWNNTFRYKDLTLSMLIDFRIGGKVVSMTEATLDGYGVSERTGRARDRGYVMREGIKFSNVKAYYDVVGATSFNSVYNVEDYVYDATNVRMREISLGYTFRNLFGQSKNLTLAFIARNLFFFYKDAPMDPDVSMGTGNGLQGFDVFNLPTTRSFGLNVKLNF